MFKVCLLSLFAILTTATIFIISNRFSEKKRVIGARYLVSATILIICLLTLYLTGM